MNDNDETPGFRPDAGESDDVEILEVVGVDDDIPAPSGEADDRLPADPDEVVLTLDADSGEDLAEAEESERDAETEGPAEPEIPEVDPALLESELVQRLRADYDNLRKRVAREREDFQQQANSSLIEALLPILDNFDRALSVEVLSSADGAFRAGMVMIYEQFAEAFRGRGERVLRVGFALWASEVAHEG